MGDTFALNLCLKNLIFRPLMSYRGGGTTYPEDFFIIQAPMTLEFATR